MIKSIYFLMIQYFQRKKLSFGGKLLASSSHEEPILDAFYEEEVRLEATPGELTLL